MRKKVLKSFVRYDGNHNLIPGGNIRASKAPKVGKWVEVTDDECCLTTTTTMDWFSTRDCYYVYLHGVVESGTTWDLLECGTDEYVSRQMDQPELTVCLKAQPVLAAGIGTWDVGGECAPQ